MNPVAQFFAEIGIASFFLVYGWHLKNKKKQKNPNKQGYREPIKEQEHEAVNQNQ